jgi:hypothetical protein
VLVGYALLLVTWVVYLALMSARPGWLLMMWGQGDVAWAFVRMVSLWLLGIQVVHVVSDLIVLWLTLWEGSCAN